MNKRRIIVIWMAATLVAAALTHYVAVLSSPHLLMSLVMDTVVQTAGVNTVVHPDRATAADRAFPAPSPDLIYSLVVFDVSDKPLRITAPIPDSYLSIAMYGVSNDNFFTMNDRQMEGKTLDVTLAGPNSQLSSESAQLIRAPSSKGVIVFRYFVADDGQLERIESIRRHIVLERGD